MRVWRICPRTRQIDAFSGEGPKLYGGRWSRVGVRVVYTSESLSLACLEVLAQLEKRGRLPVDWIAIPADIPETATVWPVEVLNLPENWRSYPAPAALQRIGTRWQRDGRSAVLSVPSAIVPSERNYLLNPTHPRFADIKVGKPEEFELDPRILKRRR